ncbi:Pkinase domain-containing protein [Rhizoctonia solani AG-1 IA]|uniref:Pkinase domain-containing protein n=1 Tax=Thanatephorus cucumeris (strain AG1-IA) TaxID=983506 RepID=L8X674_THACA|nr:Pkinase domain-containing protein [Rhizoctonia solani AG-1 IA]
MSFLKPKNWRIPQRKKSLISTKVFEILVNNGCRDITNEIDTSLCTEYPVSNGGFGDIYEGQLRDGTKTAVKCLRIFDSPMDKRINENLKLAAREIYAWSRCQHRNVVPLLGFTFFRGQIAMISPWMENGPLPQYLQREKKVDRFEVGLEYLHEDSAVDGSRTLVHRMWIKVNVLISSERIAKLIDFGNTESNDRFLEFTPARVTPTPRWAAPELLGEEGVYSVAADVYALGMVTLEAVTNKLPFPDLRSDNVIIAKVLIKKENPSRPMSIIPDRLYGNMFWNMLVSCWQYDPSNRPTMASVIREPLPDIPAISSPDSSVKSRIISQPRGSNWDFNQILDTLGEHNCRDITSSIAYDRCGNIPIKGGGSTDIYQGELADGQLIAIKCPRRFHGRLDPVVLMNTARELYIWSKCNHPNILPLLGYSHFRDRLVIVTPWMLEGCLVDYIQGNPSLDRIQAVSTLNDFSIRPILSSLFRRCMVISKRNHSLQLSTPNSQMQSFFWAPPEILNGDTERTFAADVYSLGMITLNELQEIITGEYPFAGVLPQRVVAGVLYHGLFPVRPYCCLPPKHQACDGLWTLFKDCWLFYPEMRPSVTELYRFLQVFATFIDPADLSPGDHGGRIGGQCGMCHIHTLPDESDHPDFGTVALTGWRSVQCYVHQE